MLNQRITSPFDNNFTLLPVDYIEEPRYTDGNLFAITVQFFK